MAELTLEAAPCVTSLLRSILFIKAEAVEWLTTDTAEDQLKKTNKASLISSIETDQMTKPVHSRQLKQTNKASLITSIETDQMTTPVHSPNTSFTSGKRTTLRKLLAYGNCSSFSTSRIG